MFETVCKFEKTIANFYNSPFAVATDSCTHAIELVLRYNKIHSVTCPKHTYLSIPMTFIKLGLNFKFTEEKLKRYKILKKNI